MAKHICKQQTNTEKRFDSFGLYTICTFHFSFGLVTIFWVLFGLGLHFYCIFRLCWEIGFFFLFNAKIYFCSWKQATHKQNKQRTWTHFHSSGPERFSDQHCLGQNRLQLFPMSQFFAHIFQTFCNRSSCIHQFCNFFSIDAAAS